MVIDTLDDYRRMVPGCDVPQTSIALTIDDGPHPVWTPRILELLSKHQAMATFCLIGNQVHQHRGVAGLITAAGHSVANHSWSHPLELASMSTGDIASHITRTQDKIAEATGSRPSLFRAPGGSWSSRLLDQIAAHGMLPLGWNRDPRDWARPGTSAIAQTFLAARAGDIILCHDGGGDRSQTYAALQHALPVLREQGHTFVAL